MWCANTALSPLTAANLRPVLARAEHEQLRALVHDGGGHEPRVRVPFGEPVAEEGEQLGDLAGELRAGVDLQPAAQHVRGQRVGAGRAAEREVDAAGVHRHQRAERLGDLERRVVGQHDAGRADPDPLGARRRRARSGSPARCTPGWTCCGARTPSTAGTRPPPTACAIPTAPVIDSWALSPNSIPTKSSTDSGRVGVAGSGGAGKVILPASAAVNRPFPRHLGAPDGNVRSAIGCRPRHAHGRCGAGRLVAGDVLAWSRDVLSPACAIRSGRSAAAVRRARLRSRLLRHRAGRRRCGGRWRPGQLGCHIDADGVIAGVAAYGLWGFFPLYFPLLEPAVRPGDPRRTGSCGRCWSSAILVVATRGWPKVRAILGNRRQLLLLAVASAADRGQLGRLHLGGERQPRRRERRWATSSTR